MRRASWSAASAVRDQDIVASATAATPTATSSTRTTRRLIGSAVRAAAISMSPLRMPRAGRRRTRAPAGCRPRPWPARWSGRTRSGTTAKRVGPSRPGSSLRERCARTVPRAPARSGRPATDEALPRGSVQRASVLAGAVGRVLRGPLVGAAVALGADRRVGGVQDQAEVRGAVARDHGVAAGQVVRVGDQQLLDAVQPGDGDLPADQQVRQQGRDRGPVGADERLQLAGRRPRRCRGPCAGRRRWCAGCR